MNNYKFQAQAENPSIYSTDRYLINKLAKLKSLSVTLIKPNEYERSTVIKSSPLSLPPLPPSSRSSSSIQSSAINIYTNDFFKSEIDIKPISIATPIAVTATSPLSSSSSSSLSSSPSHYTKSTSPNSNTSTKGTSKIKPKYFVCLCPNCQLGCVKNNKSTRHIFSHCCVWPNCKREFIRTRDLKDHLRTSHNVGKSYFCHKKRCERQFITESDLKNHIAKDHITKLKCNFCQITFSTKICYTLHIKTYHCKIE